MIWYRGDLETWVCGPGVQFSVVGLALGWDMVLGCMSQSGAGVYRKSRYAVFNLILGLTDSLGLWVLLGSLDRWSLLRAWDYGVTSGYGNHSQCWDEKASWVDRSLLGAWCHESCLGLLEPADIEVRGYVFLGADKEPPRFIGIGLVLGRPALLPQWVCLSPHWAFWAWGRSYGDNMILSFLSYLMHLFFSPSGPHFRCCNPSPEVLSSYEGILIYR